MSPPFDFIRFSKFSVWVRRFQDGNATGNAISALMEPMHTAEDVLKVMQSLMKLESIALDQLSLFAPKSSAEYDDANRISAGTSISEVLAFGGTDDKNPLFLVVPDGERIS